MNRHRDSICAAFSLPHVCRAVAIAQRMGMDWFLNLASTSPSGIGRPNPPAPIGDVQGHWRRWATTAQLNRMEVDGP